MFQYKSQFSTTVTIRSSTVTLRPARWKFQVWKQPFRVFLLVDRFRAHSPGSIEVSIVAAYVLSSGYQHLHRTCGHRALGLFLVLVLRTSQAIASRLIGVELCCVLLQADFLLQASATVLLKKNSSYPSDRRLHNAGTASRGRGLNKRLETGNLQLRDLCQDSTPSDRKKIYLGL